MDKTSQLQEELFFGGCCNHAPAFFRIWALPEHIISIKKEKLSSASATTFARWMVDFSLSTQHSHMSWLTLQTIKRDSRGIGDVKAGLWVPLYCVLPANVFEATFFMTIALLLSSVLAFDCVCSIKSSASASHWGRGFLALTNAFRPWRLSMTLSYWAAIFALAC